MTAASVLVTAVLAWAGIVNGVTDIDSARLLATLLPAGEHVADPLDRAEWVALVQLRLPRIVMAVVAGVGLALCGATMQIITGNPMASPFTTGISNAAAFGASLAILGGLTVAGSTMLGTVLCAFVGAVLCSLLVLAIAGVTRMGPTVLILAGIALSYLFAALAASVQYVADEQQLASIIHWTFGDLGRASWPQIAGASVVVCAAAVHTLSNARNYTRLVAGDEVARSLGVPVGRLRVEVGVIVTVVAATIISITGVIGFVGLVAPHIAAMLVGSDERYRLPLAALVGAALLLAADLVGRLVLSPVIIPVGIVVSLVGVPLFVWLILREGRWAR
ncbi:FecCD family ABC transporter permease [Gordonia sp. NPDC058843]|uniref:FecCD family ABC transporter permease n=1 Tax=Gordonia sp. NPDC058843 TaxID=3346648 RepID=UPI0036AE5DA9